MKDKQPCFKVVIGESEWHLATMKINSDIVKTHIYTCDEHAAEAQALLMEREKAVK